MANRGTNKDSGERVESPSIVQPSGEAKAYAGPTGLTPEGSLTNCQPAPARGKRKRMTKAERREAFAGAFNRWCGELAVDKFGARKLTDEESRVDDPTFVMATKYGTMRIWPATDADSVLDGIHRGSFFTVFCRFDTHDREVLRRAADHLDSNPYSGKYNFHRSAGNEQTDLESALRAFERHLAAVAVVTPEGT